MVKENTPNTSYKVVEKARRAGRVLAASRQYSKIRGNQNPQCVEKSKLKVNPVELEEIEYLLRSPQNAVRLSRAFEEQCKSPGKAFKQFAIWGRCLGIWVYCGIIYP